MEALTQVFRQRQRNGLRCSNETKAGAASVDFKQVTGDERNNRLKARNMYFAHLRPKMENEFIEFADHYEINLYGSTVFEKDEVTIRYNEIDNQLKIVGFQSKKFGDRVIVNRKLLRCFNLPENINADAITSVMKNRNLIKIRIPKYKNTVIDGNSDGEHDQCYECTEYEEI